MIAERISHDAGDPRRVSEGIRRDQAPEALEENTPAQEIFGGSIIERTTIAQ